MSVDPTKSLEMSGGLQLRSGDNISPFRVGSAGVTRDGNPVPDQVAPEVGVPEIGVVPGDVPTPYIRPSLRTVLRKHGTWWTVRVAWQLVFARLQLRRCNSVGRWVRAQGRVVVHNQGTILVGNRVRFLSVVAPTELVAWKGGRIEIGDGTVVNYGSSISAAGSVKIGRDCLVGTYVNIMDSTFHNMKDHSWSLDSAPVTIGDGVWLGNRCVIMKGVTIGDGAVIASCSLVTRDVPARTMVVGVPARVVQHL